MNFHDALPKIGRQSISFLIKDLITSYLLSGELKPGDKLPTEIDLAHKLGVGRNSVREALKMLSSIGVLEVRKGSGTFIAKRMKPSILNPLILSLVFEQGTSKEFIELRLLLEIGSAELALSKITARDLEGHVADLVEAAMIERICPARVAGFHSGAEDIGVSLKIADESTAISAKLLVGADGGLSSVRKLLDIEQQVTDYGQTALVTTVKSSLPNHYTAYERFTSSGPLALLPAGERHSAVVWTRSREDAETWLSANEDEFIAELQNCFGYRLGELTLAAPRRAFPLTLIRAESMVSGRAVIIGNAAHQLHPVAGQGFNLGLRDVAKLAEALIKQHEQGLDIGDAGLLKAYADARKADHDRTIRFTDQLIHIFSNDWILLAAARNTGLCLLDQIPAVKSLLSRQAMGLAGRLPRLGTRS